MDKSTFLTKHKPAEHEVTIGGEAFTIRGLTVSQRKKFYDASKEDMFKAQAVVVCMGMPILSDEDIDEVLEMDSKLITELADAILVKSGLADDEEEGDPTKNS